MPLMGIQLDALSVAGSLLLHAVYGLTLGAIFGQMGDYRMSTDLVQTPRARTAPHLFARRAPHFREAPPRAHRASPFRAARPPSAR